MTQSSWDRRTTNHRGLSGQSLSRFLQDKYLRALLNGKAVHCMVTPAVFSRYPFIVRRDKLAWSSFLSCDTTQWHWGGNGRRGGGGVVLPYISHIGMCRPKGLGFLRRFGLKKGTDSVHFSLESGMVLEGAAPHPPPRIPRSSPPLRGVWVET